MPLDEMYYKKFIEFFEKTIKEIFDCNMINLSKECNFNYRGTFKLTYNYVPNNYKIIIENEFRTFDIVIQDTQGASNVLYRIEHYHNNLDEKNINESIVLLKKVLEEDSFNLYFYNENKLYRKNSQGIKRIKDIKELLNG